MNNLASILDTILVVTQYNLDCNIFGFIISNNFKIYDYVSVNNYKKDY